MRTGQPPISDAEKKRRGTFDSRWSEEKRAARNEAKVVALFGADAVSAIPEPPAGLYDRARVEYDRWTRRLFEIGRLTQVWVDKITLYAIRRHGIELRLAAGKAPKADDVKASELFLKELELLNVDASSPGQEAPASKWSAIGFAARQPRQVAPPKNITKPRGGAA